MAGDEFAIELVTLWETRREDMMTGEVNTALLENLVKAAQVGGKPKIKFLGFKSIARNGKKVLNIVAKPADAYVKPAGGTEVAEKPKTSW